MLGAELITPLIIGEKYFISFKASLSSLNFCASNNLGVLFSTVPHIDTAQTFSTWNIENFAHINFTLITTDTSNWTTISGDFIADSAYKYIIIGNFFNNSNTDIFITNNDTNCQIYYYIDDICVSIDSSTCDIQTDIVRHKLYNKINIYPNPTKNTVFIELNKNINAKIEIYNLSGELMLEKHINTKKETINLTNFNSGIYFIKLLTRKEVLTKKLVILK